MELRPGYKQTELGVIPEDWQEVCFTDVFSIVSGQVDPRIEPYRQMTLLAPDHLESNTGKIIKRVTAEVQGAISGKYLFSSGDIIYSKIRPYLKKATLVNFDGLCSADMYALRVTHQNDASFLMYVILDKPFSEFAVSVSARTGIPKINREDLATYTFYLPELSEQKAIAAALSDIDALLDSLGALIAKKRDMKKAAMQELLTGKTRLPGFGLDKGYTQTELGVLPEDWTVVPLSSICTMKSGEGITGSYINNSGLYPCYGGNGLRGYTSRFTHEGKFCLIGRQGALCGNVFEVDGRFFASEHAVVVTAFLEIFISWLTYVLKDMNLNQYSESSAQPGLSVAKLAPLPVACPSFAEQKAIAEVLSDMDAELEALEARYAKVRDMKIGMMQELLTGKTRLIPAGE